MAPEYAMRGYLTEKADVYSFGVVALEIVSGKSNTNFRPSEEFVYLLDWVKHSHLFHPLKEYLFFSLKEYHKPKYVTLLHSNTCRLTFCKRRDVY